MAPWPAPRQHCGIYSLRCSGAILLFVPAAVGALSRKHPVNHELHRYGKVREVAARLDREMGELVETIGPFRFTATMLVYDSGLEFQMIPYDKIAAAEIPDSNDIPSLRIRTRNGRQYEWFRSWMQGSFNPDEVVAKIRSKANIPDSTTEQPTTDDGRPTTKS